MLSDPSIRSSPPWALPTTASEKAMVFDVPSLHIA